MSIRKFDNQFKNAAVKFIPEGGYSIKEVSQKLDTHVEAKQVKRFEFLLKHHGKIKINHVVKVLKVSRSEFYEYVHRRPPNNKWNEKFSLRR
jgi:hypothetical protein